MLELKKVFTDFRHPEPLGVYALVSLQKKNGGRCSILKEPSVVRLNYELTWMKPKIDLRELAKLRESGLSFREIERMTKVGKTTIMRKLLRYYEQKEKC